MYRRLQPHGPPFNGFEINRVSQRASRLAGWWPPLGSAGSRRVRDLAAQNPGDLQSGVSWVGDSVMGTVLGFDGSNNAYINVPGPHFGPTLSISVWVWFEDFSPTQHQAICGEFDNPGTTWFLYRRWGGGSTFQISLFDGSDTTFDFSSAVAQTWHHIVFTNSPSGAQGYWNGVPQTTTGGAQTWSSTSNTFAIGKWTGSHLKGRIADISISSRVIEAAEVRALYEAGAHDDLYDAALNRRLPSASAAAILPPPPVPVPNILTAGRAWMARPTETTFQVWLFSPQGYRQQLIAEYASLSFSEGIRGGGRFTLELPPNFNTRYVKHLSYIVIEECCAGLAPRLEDVYVVQSIGGAMAAGGTRFLTLEGPTATDYFVGEHSRVVTLDSVSGGATDAADDLLRGLVREALGAGAGNSGTAEGRDLSVYAGFTVEGDRGMGPSFQAAVGFLELDKALAEIVRRSDEAESGALRLFFYCRPVSFNPLRFQFVVLPRLFGKYRGFRSSAPIILSPEWGTISTVETEYDLSEGWNSVYVAYNDKMSWTRVTDTARRNIAPHGFRETLYESAVLGMETAKLNEGKPRRMSRYKLANSRSVRWGMYGMGDVVGTLVGGAREELEVAGFKVDHGSDGVKREIRVDAWEG